MRKFTIVACLLSFSFWSFAQVIAKGQKILGGTLNIGYTSNKLDPSISTPTTYKDSRAFDSRLSPSFGKAIKNNLVFGYTLSMGYSSSRSFDPNSFIEGKSRGGHYGLGFFLERFFPLGKGFFLSGATTLNASLTPSKNVVYVNSLESSVSKSQPYGIGLDVVPTISYSINKRILAQLLLVNFLSVGYSVNNVETEGLNIPKFKQRTTHFGFGSAINNPQKISDVGIGFRYIL